MLRQMELKILNCYFSRKCATVETCKCCYVFFLCYFYLGKRLDSIQMYQVTVRHNKIDQTKARRIARSEEKWRFDNESHFLLFTYVLNSVAPFKYQQRHLERNCIYKQEIERVRRARIHE